MTVTPVLRAFFRKGTDSLAWGLRGGTAPFDPKEMLASLPSNPTVVGIKLSITDIDRRYAG